MLTLVFRMCTTNVVWKFSLSGSRVPKRDPLDQKNEVGRAHVRQTRRKTLFRTNHAANASALREHAFNFGKRNKKHTSIRYSNIHISKQTRKHNTCASENQTCKFQDSHARWIQTTACKRHVCDLNQNTREIDRFMHAQIKLYHTKWKRAEIRHNHEQWMKCNYKTFQYSMITCANTHHESTT